MIPHLSFVSVNRTRRPKVTILEGHLYKVDLQSTLKARLSKNFAKTWCYLSYGATLIIGSLGFGTNRLRPCGQLPRVLERRRVNSVTRNRVLELSKSSLTDIHDTLSLKPVAHDAYFPAGLESCHRIGCDAVNAQRHQYDGKILIQLAIQQENKHRVLQPLETLNDNRFCAREVRRGSLLDSSTSLMMARDLS
ncbi:hypothetical protein G5I_05057 [Acromyrmex echinatior]|uniref:Uncharacterized protein n=1 Tax=Acromyrmex echinatior TaxID=103372 RepID=F4WH97_ACREC|nr:hypothetical protein G5I_05057 [Acromyrmex echinatior]